MRVGVMEEEVEEGEWDVESLKRGVDMKGGICYGEGEVRCGGGKKVGVEVEDMGNMGEGNVWVIK